MEDLFQELPAELDEGALAIAMGGFEHQQTILNPCNLRLYI